MPPTIIAAYSVAGNVVAAVDGPDVPWIARKAKSVVSMLGGADIEEALERGPLRITDDGKRIELAGGNRRVDIADLMDIQNAQVAFVSWRANAVRYEITREELAGCWQTFAGYTLLESGGHVRIKLVGKGTASDLAGDWQWSVVDAQEFKLVRTDADQSHTYRLAAYDGKAMILSVATHLTIGAGEQVIVMPTVWKRSKPPRSWT